MAKSQVAFTARPGKAAQPPAENGADAAAVEHFVNGADVIRRNDAHANGSKGARAAPNPYAFFDLDNERKLHALNLRMTDREKGALAFVSETTGVPMHAIVMEALIKELNEKLQKLTGRTL